MELSNSTMTMNSIWCMNFEVGACVKIMIGMKNGATLALFVLLNHTLVIQVSDMAVCSFLL